MSRGLAIIFGASAFVFFVGLLAANRDISNFRHTAIQHNAAHYDPKTGDFTWNDEKEGK